jgi:hypothetical protein
MNWSVKKDSDVQTTIEIPYRAALDWEQWGLIYADAHLDNPHCQRDLHKRHLDQAKERGAFIMSFGDLFDAMQGKQDRRSNKSDLDSKLKSGTYLNDLVEFAHDFYEPYFENIALFAEGNHETSVTNRYEYSLLDGLIYSMRKSDSPVVRGGYRGWIRFQFKESYNAGENNAPRSQSRLAYYLHGSGGGGPVTKGIIQTNRRAVYLPDADYVFSGHIHESWIFPMQRVRISANGFETLETQYHVQLPTYKEEFANLGGGWHHETGKPPKPTGAYWIRFYYVRETRKIEAMFIEADKY